MRHLALIVAASALLAAAPTSTVAAQLPHRHLDARLVPPFQEPARRLSPAVAVASSAIVPGSGQYLLGADRWVPFLAIEIWGWLSYVDRRRDTNSFAAQYRDLAWSVARRVSIGPRRDTVFEYYESMAHFSSSGLFDSNPRIGGIQPETDTTTFNGEQWQLAKSLFFPGGIEFPVGSVQYAQAFQYYLVHAIPPGYAWAWGGSNLEQQTFREFMRLSDSAARTATQLLGVIMMNHVVSAIDALVLARIRERHVDGARFELGSGLTGGAAGTRWTARARLYW